MGLPRLGLISNEIGIRLLLVGVFSAVLYALIPSSSMDLHLRARGAQPISDRVYVLEVDGLYKLQAFVKKTKSPLPFKILLYRNAILNPDPNRPNLQFYRKFIDIDDQKKEQSYLDINLVPDSDGQLRRYSGTFDLSNAQSFALREHLINYRGERWTFPRISLPELENDNLEDFSDFVFIIENRLNPNSFVTPLGSITESEIIANIVDNQLEGRQSRTLGKLYTILVALTLLLLSLVTSLYLPALFSLVAIFGLSVLYLLLTVFLFDQMYFRLPILPPLLQILTTYLVFSNFRQSKEEYDKWQFQQRMMVDKEINSMKNNFLSLFSHDLKTPLAKIIGITEKLVNHEKSPENKGELDKIKVLSKELQGSIQRILKISLLESESLKLQKNPEDLNEIVENTIRKAKLIAEEKEIKIHLNKEVLFLADMDRVLIEEVIFNFVENAIKYGRRNGNIWISTLEKDENIILSVEDDGPGLKDEDSSLVWTKFYRGEKKQEGYGLGLYLSKYVIDLHGGEIFLKKSTHDGCNFGFRLPT